MAVRHDALQELVGRTRPVMPAGEQVLPLLPALSGLLPWGGLRRGATVSVRGPGGSSLAFALLAAVSAAGSWCALVGMPTAGLVAAAQLGVDLGRLALVPAPGSQWPVVVAALLDALDVVVVQPPSRVRAGDVRRLTARARERGAVLLGVGGWEGADVRLAVRGRWEGLAQGHGQMCSRRVEVVAEGRGAAARPRRARLWLPAADGGVAVTGGVDVPVRELRSMPRRTRAGPHPA